MRYNSASDWLKGMMLGSKTNHSTQQRKSPHSRTIFDNEFNSTNFRVLLISSLEKLSARTIFQILDIHSRHTD